MERLPLIDPNPPRLSTAVDALRRIEASGHFSNNGPELRAFEAEATERLFGGEGATLALANATLGLILALADATRGRADLARRPYAIVPALTFAATAQAAWWAGLTPLVVDVDADDWCMSAAAVDAALARHGDAVAAIVPYAAFGRAIDLDRYLAYRERHGVAVVVDAAASLGTRDPGGRHFGAGSPLPVVFSMHATKPFAVAEGGLVHCGDAGLVARLRAMAGFGFEAGRSATLPGLNAKLPEVIATMARLKLAGFDADAARRDAVVDGYRAAAPHHGTQVPAPGTQAHAFFPVLLPRDRAADRASVIARMDAAGIGVGSYFSPHLGQQPWVGEVATVEPTPVADDLAARLLSLPVADAMTADDAYRVVAALDRVLAAPRAVVTVRDEIADTLLVGGGPAGSALLTAASRNGLLPALAAGLVVVEAGATLGGGRLGGYGITSDSSAETFLTALAGDPHPEIAALSATAAARRVAAHRGALGVPLTLVGPLLDAIASRLTMLVERYGGTVLARTRATAARRLSDGTWSVTLRTPDGGEREQRARRLVLATGGHQPLGTLAAAEVAGERLATLADGRLVTSDALLAVGGVRTVEDLLRHRRAPRIAVIGGSTSAVTATVALLKADLPLGHGALTLLHRRPLRPFYPSVEAAHAENYTDFDARDVCPVSRFVYRLAGFRLEARELVLRQLGVDGRAADPRVALHAIAGNDDAAARDLIRDADLVVAALGYRPRALPLVDERGGSLALAADAGGTLVDRHCRILDAAGRPVPDAYAIGLAAGFVPWGKLGGEASFRGQANGLWLWQNDVGLMIVDQLLGRVAQEAAA